MTMHNIYGDEYRSETFSACCGSHYSSKAKSFPKNHKGIYLIEGVVGQEKDTPTHVVKHIQTRSGPISVDTRHYG